MIPQSPPPFLITLGQWGIDSGVYGLMNSAWGWPIVEIIHFLGLCLLMGTVGMFDLAMIGLVRGLSLRALHRLIPYGVTGFALCVGSGFLFILASPLDYIYNSAWQFKMALMLVAGLNMIAFYVTLSPAVKALGADDRPPLAARIMAYVSLGCWLGVISCGRVITAFRPYME